MDINRKVITQELQYYLGPDATVRPYTREGEDGFLITTAGSCLTDVSKNPSVRPRECAVDVYSGANRRHLLEVEGDVGEAGSGQIAAAQPRQTVEASTSPTNTDDEST